jgi:hypothetical protein
LEGEGLMIRRRLGPTRLGTGQLPFAVAAIAAGGAAAQDAPPSYAVHLNPLSSLRPSDLRAFKERPLFTPSRAPPPVAQAVPEVAAAPPAPVEEPAPEVRLAGVIHGAAQVMAILQRTNGGGRSTVRVGDLVDGWTVTAIEPSGIRLASGSRERAYGLFARGASSEETPDRGAAGGPRQRPRPEP